MTHAGAGVKVSRCRPACLTAAQALRYKAGAAAAGVLPRSERNQQPA